MYKLKKHFLRKRGPRASSFPAAIVLLTQDGLDRSCQGGAVPSEHRCGKNSVVLGIRTAPIGSGIGSAHDLGL